MMAGSNSTIPVELPPGAPGRSNIGPALARLKWESDRMLMNNLVFRLVRTKSEAWNGPEHFLLYKDRGLIEEYADFFSRIPSFSPANVLELGIYDGGSLAFWYELLRPRKLAAIDLMTRGDGDYFRQYVASRGIAKSISPHWGVDQADKDRLRQIVAEDFAESIDLVIDDCSHLYGPTLASFETLFPSLAYGGYYIIEDWAWAHFAQFNEPPSPLAFEKPLTRLAAKIVEAAGSQASAIRSVTVMKGFIAVERGWSKSVSSQAPFALKEFLVRRPIRQIRLPKELFQRLLAMVHHLGARALPHGTAGRRMYNRLKQAFRTCQDTIVHKP